MEFNSPLGLRERQKYAEGSNCGISARDDRNNSFLWKKGMQHSEQGHETNQALQRVMREVSKMKRRIVGGTPMIKNNPPFHPFQIYKPDVKQVKYYVFGDPNPRSGWINNNSIGFSFDSDGNPGSAPVTIDPSQPTNIDDSGSGNVNPTTDGWRIWAVRTGLISSRIIGNAQIFKPGNDINITMPDFSGTSEVYGCDGEAIGHNYLSLGNVGHPYEFNPNELDINGNGICPIILPTSTFPNNTGNFGFCIWIQVDNEVGYPALHGKGFDFDTVDLSTVFPVPMTSNTIAVGAICKQGYRQYIPGGNPLALTPYQLLYGSNLNRYGSYDNSFLEDTSATTGPLNYSATLNFRGSWQNDDITTQYFYPGDVVQFQEQINISTIPASSIYSQSLFMCGVAGNTSDPSTDPNWTRISGIKSTPQTNRTPNTH